MRYVKLYFTCLKRSLISRLEYKKDTLIGILSFFLGNLTSILSIYFIINSIPSLQGYSMYELGFLYGFSMLPVSIDHLFSDDLWNVSYWKVRNGDMDRHFLRPIPVLFQVLAETFQPEAIGELIVGIIMLALCAGKVQITWTFGFILLLGIAAIFGALLITAMKTITASFAFIFKRSGILTQIVYNFISYTKYPINIYPNFLKGLLTFLFPFALVISFPIETILFNAYSPYLLSLIIIIVTLLFFALAILIWVFCAKRYESSGS